MSILSSPRHRGCHSVRARVAPFAMGRPPQRRQADTLVELEREQWASEFSTGARRLVGLSRLPMGRRETGRCGSRRPAMRFIGGAIRTQTSSSLAARVKDRAGLAHEWFSGCEYLNPEVSLLKMRSHRAHAHSEQMRAASARISGLASSRTPSSSPRPSSKRVHRPTPGPPAGRFASSPEAFGAPTTGFATALMPSASAAAPGGHASRAIASTCSPEIAMSRSLIVDSGAGSVACIRRTASTHTSCCRPYRVATPRNGGRGTSSTSSQRFNERSRVAVIRASSANVHPVFGLARDGRTYPVRRCCSFRFFARYSRAVLLILCGCPILGKLRRESHRRNPGPANPCVARGDGCAEFAPEWSDFGVPNPSLTAFRVDQGYRSHALTHSWANWGCRRLGLTRFG